jgi:GT2 family glycosyltransferase
MRTPSRCCSFTLSHAARSLTPDYDMRLRALPHPIVSVVMAVRNGAAYLAEALQSIQRQTLLDLELIVVDDGSTDRTPRILADFASGDDRIRVLRLEKSGVSAALNRACAEARSTYLARMDADDVALPERLALQVAFLKAHPDVVVVGGAGIFTDERGLELGVSPYPETDAEVAEILDSGRSPVIHPSVTMARKAFRAVGGYRSIVDGAEDYDLWLRMSSHGRITNIPEPVLRYRIHDKQHSTRSFEATARATCAALAAARARARGERDPLDGVTSLDSAVLEQLGVRSEHIASQEVNYAMWLARTLARGGRVELAQPLWSFCMARAPATASPRLTRARILRARGDACRRRGSHPASLRLRLLAAALDPKGAVARARASSPAKDG